MGLLLVAGGGLLIWRQMGDSEATGDDLPEPGPGVTAVKAPEPDDTEVFQAALDGFLAVARSLDGIPFTVLEGTADIATTPGENATLRSAFVLRWGAGLVIRFDQTLQTRDGRPCLQPNDGGLCYRETRYCTPDHVTIVSGRDALLRRVPRGMEGDHCLAGVPFAGLGSLAEPAVLEGLRMYAIEYHDDGAVVARYRGDGGVRLGLVADANRTLGGIELETSTTRLDLRFHRGDQAPLTVPEAITRVPAQQIMACDPCGGSETAGVWTVQAAPEAPLLGEMEARIYPVASNEETAAFLLVPGEDQEINGVHFRFSDSNGDGRLSEGDQLFVAAASENPVKNYRVILYDQWAQANTQAVQASSLSWGISVAVAFVAAALRRR